MVDRAEEDNRVLERLFNSKANGPAETLAGTGMSLVEPYETPRKGRQQPRSEG